MGWRREPESSIVRHEKRTRCGCEHHADTSVCAYAADGLCDRGEGQFRLAIYICRGTFTTDVVGLTLT